MHTLKDTPGGTLRDRLWIWGHVPGSHDVAESIPRPSIISPVEAAHYMGIPNLVMVAYGGEPVPPWDREARAHMSLKRVVWSIVGDASSTRNDQSTDLDEVVSLAKDFPNITGAIMDDFFHNEPDEKGEYARYSVDDLNGFASALHTATRKLDLWVVLYKGQLDQPFQKHLDECDVVTFWTWYAKDLARLEKNFELLEERAPGIRKILGCYLWDHGVKRPMPVDLMEKQCELGRKWLKEGRIEGMIFLSNCICDIGMDAVEWSREWIERYGDESL